MVLKQQGIHTHMNESGLVFHIIYKKIHLKSIRDLYVRYITINFLEKNIGVNIHELELCNSFCYQRSNIIKKSEAITHRIGESLCKSCLIRGLHLEYKKKELQLNHKKTNNPVKNRQRFE